MSTSTLAGMSPQVLARLQDPDGIFWSLDFEIYPALAEAISELLLIVGRPTVAFNQQVTIQPNNVFQAIPSNLLCITNITINGSILWKSTLRSLDYLQASWGPSWQSDRGPVPLRWAPLGLNYFITHPASLEPVYAQVAGIQYPFSDSWPYSGSDVSVFHREVNQALEMYSAAYCRIKEVGNDFLEGQELYKRFQAIAARLSVIEDRRDSLVWTQSFGAPTAPSQTSKR